MGSIMSEKVLVLNKHWLATRIIDLERCLRKVCANRASIVDPETHTPYPWTRQSDGTPGWIDLPVEGDQPFIKTTSGKIRLPKLIVLSKYDKVRRFKVKLTAKNLRSRDGMTCQYTGKKLKPSEATKDHVIPLSRGGKDVWHNVVLCDAEVNRKKSNKTPEEAGLPTVKPVEPTWNPLYTANLKQIDPSWVPYLAHLGQGDATGKQMNG